MEDMTSAELKELDFQSYFKMGLVTQEVRLSGHAAGRMLRTASRQPAVRVCSKDSRLLQEWELIKQQEEDGVQGWRTVYTWAAALLAEAVTNGRMEDRLVRGRSCPRGPPLSLWLLTHPLSPVQGPAAGIHAMLLEIRNAGGRIFTMMGSQLPYTYVHLVSFVCHVFLWVLASYFGFVLHSGIPQVKYDLVMHQAGAKTELLGDVSSKRSGSLAQIDDNWWLFRLQIYIFITFSNTLVQGLLSMHALLENPFGVHPCKFPLRAYAIDHIRQTRAMLKAPSEREPDLMRNLFKVPPPERSVTRRTGDLSALAAEASSKAAGGAAGGGEALTAAQLREGEKRPLLEDEDQTGGSML